MNKYEIQIGCRNSIENIAKRGRKKEMLVDTWYHTNEWICIFTIEKIAYSLPSPNMKS